ncbi:hypothetical protein M8J76_012338 [Diaphorina citri]|nr:hypothetical protein M8J76_012338 [Diaphorina citri]
MESIVSLEKPKPKVADSDWHAKIFQLRHSCDTRRQYAFNLKNEARQITEISRWKDALDKCQSQIEKEIQQLSEEKSLTEREIELYNLNFTVVNECLTLRDEKTSNDLCRDAVERELNAELRTLETFKKIFTAKVQEAWEQINRLQDIRYKILCDINDKEEAVSIDSHCLGLDKHSANITLKHNALKSPQSQIPHEAWLENARYLKQRGESEVSASKKLRESIVLPRDQSHNELCTQNEQTNYAMRKRIYETMKIRNELEWQKTVLIPDKEKLHAEVRQLEINIEDLDRKLKLAETRAEARLYRPGLELVRDEPYEGLTGEVLSLRNMLRQMTDKLAAARSAVNSLDDQLTIIQLELQTKTQVLDVETRCLGLRDRLVSGARRPPSNETDRNVILTNLARQIPPEPRP